jgi:anthranilate synthase/aminodeoxychorismate synthase-like glutamine amidotransferase
MILVIDNYDSFTYNLVQYLGDLGAKLRVCRNDKITLGKVKTMKPTHIVISPGPGIPADAGLCRDIIARFGDRIPILGVCLGHQAIAEVFGGVVVRAASIVHGKTSWIRHDGQTIFRGTPNPFCATRYHSLIVEKASLPDCLEISAWTDDGIIMALRHRSFPIEGVQFHPESILTKVGLRILANFLEGSFGVRPRN